MSNKALGLNGHKNIDCFVHAQIKSLKDTNESFESLFRIMFSVPDNVMFEYTDGNKIFKVTYGECLSKITEVATNIKSLTPKLSPNSIIGLYMDNGIEWIQVFWAILMAGHRPLLMNKRVDKEVLTKILDEQKIDYIVSDSETFKRKHLKNEDLFKPSEGSSNFEWANEIILMTSGTSLNLKLCFYSGKNICEQIYTTKDIIKNSKLIKRHFNGHIKMLTFLPFYHVFGLVACYMWFAFFSRTFVLLKDLSGETILNTIKKHQVTHLFAVPLLWERIEAIARKKIKDRGKKLENKFNKALKFSNALQNFWPALGRCFARQAFKELRQSAFGDSIQFLISGGGNISASTLELLNGVGYRLANGYGMTEIGIASVELSNKTKWLNSCSIGKPFKSIMCKTENNELYVKGAFCADHIILNNVSTSLNSSWFKTGDIVTTKHGHLYIAGRTDDLIVGSGGENVNPNLLESKLKLGDVPIVVIPLKKNDSIRTTLLLQLNKYFSKEKLKSIKDSLYEALNKKETSSLIDDIYYTNDELMSANDIKINRKKIVNRIMSGDIVIKDLKEIESLESSAIDPALQKEIILIFEDVLNKKLNKDELSSNFFYELGGDSLLYFSIVENVKSKFGISLPLDNESMISVNGICSYIQDKI